MYKIHNIEWNAESIARFWDNQAEVSGEDSYFSKQVGNDLIKRLKKKINFREANYLDYGCGHGHLIEYVAKNTHAQLYGCDVSEDSVNVTEARTKGLGTIKWKGASIVRGNQLPYDNDFFDIITCVEVIEHLSDHVLEVLMKEFSRILKPGGIIVMTTPNQEVLKKSTVICPECGCIFHRKQHMRSWSPESIKKYFSDLFLPIETVETVLRPNGVVGLLQCFAIKCRCILTKKPLPHLIYIAKKADNENL